MRKKPWLFLLIIFSLLIACEQAGEEKQEKQNEIVESIQIQQQQQQKKQGEAVVSTLNVMLAPRRTPWSSSVVSKPNDFRA